MTPRTAAPAVAAVVAAAVSRAPARRAAPRPCVDGQGAPPGRVWRRQVFWRARPLRRPARLHSPALVRRVGRPSGDRPAATRWLRVTVQALPARALAPQPQR